MKRLKIAVVGVGHFGRAHTRQLAALEGVELAGVVDPNPDSRRLVAKEFHTAAWAHHGELAGKVDAAIVATPTRLHHAVGLDLLRAGVHLLIEKPLAGSLAEADELVDAANHHGLVLQVGHIERFNPALAPVATHIQEPKFIEARRTSGHQFRSIDIGVVLDLMIHDLDLVLALVHSPVRRVEAMGISVFGQFEDVAHARLEFENGCVALFSASRASYHTSRIMHIWSSRSFASVDFAQRCLTLVRPSEELLRREFDAEKLSPEQIEHIKEHLFDELLTLERVQAEPCDQLAAELADFVDSIRQGRSPRASGQQGRDAIALAERILSSIAEHSWDGTENGRVGPLVMPAPSVLRGPHWQEADEPLPMPRKEAG